MFEQQSLSKLVKSALLVHFYFDKRVFTEQLSLLDELDDLVSNLHISIAEKTLVYVPTEQKKYLCGSGKALEVIKQAEQLGVDSIIFNHLLSPTQQRNWEKISTIAIKDREAVILDIFSQRAQNKESKLQVQLAQMQYALPRMVRMWSHLDRESGGGVMNKGMGEKQIEVDRRLAYSKINDIKKQLTKVKQQRMEQRKQRVLQELPNIALIGYTNAGKSSLLNTLTAADVLEKDMLFATLATTTRRVDLADNLSFTLTDTVGFIRNLPHRLVQAFKSTLEEACLADLILHVLDISSPDFMEHYHTTQQVLQELKADHIPQIIIANKIDLVSDVPLTIDSLPAEKVIATSTKSERGLAEIMSYCQRYFAAQRKEYILKLPLHAHKEIAYFYQVANVLACIYTEHGNYLKVLADDKHIAPYQQFLTQHMPTSQ